MALKRRLRVCSKLPRCRDRGQGFREIRRMIRLELKVAVPGLASGRGGG